MRCKCRNNDRDQHAERKTNDNRNGGDDGTSLERDGGTRCTERARPKKPTSKRNLNADAQRSRKHRRQCAARECVEKRTERPYGNAYGAKCEGVFPGQCGFGVET